MKRREARVLLASSIFVASTLVRLGGQSEGASHIQLESWQETSHQ